MEIPVKAKHGDAKRSSKLWLTVAVLAMTTLFVPRGWAQVPVEGYACLLQAGGFVGTKALNLGPQTVTGLNSFAVFEDGSMAFEPMADVPSGHTGVNLETLTFTIPTPVVAGVFGPSGTIFGQLIGDEFSLDATGKVINCDAGHQVPFTASFDAVAHKLAEMQQVGAGNSALGYGTGPRATTNATVQVCAWDDLGRERATVDATVFDDNGTASTTSFSISSGQISCGSVSVFPDYHLSLPPGLLYDVIDGNSQLHNSRDCQDISSEQETSLVRRQCIGD